MVHRILGRYAVLCRDPKLLCRFWTRLWFIWHGPPSRPRARSDLISPLSAGGSRLCSWCPGSPGRSCFSSYGHLLNWPGQRRSPPSRSKRADQLEVVNRARRDQDGAGHR